MGGVRMCRGGGGAENNCSLAVHMYVLKMNVLTCLFLFTHATCSTFLLIWMSDSFGAHMFCLFSAMLGFRISDPA